MALSLYIHFPFCVRKCHYCDFNSLADSGIAAPSYIAALLREMEMVADDPEQFGPVATIFFGGGTPSLLPPELVRQTIEGTERCFGILPEAEITLEANPGTLSDASLSGYRSAGVNRLSLGVQSFDDRMLARLGRIHSGREAIESFAAARASGFDNIGIDLIHSLPGQTAPLWEEQLTIAVDLGPEHISAYGLSVEEGTPFASLEESGQLDLPEEDEAAAMFETTGRILTSAGYEHYEISNFARPGRRSRHNQVYWLRGDYLGLGSGAHSFIRNPAPGLRWKNCDSPVRYIELLQQSILPREQAQRLNTGEAMSEAMFLGLRLLNGIDPAAFSSEFAIDIKRAFAPELDRLLQSGLLEETGTLLRLSRRGLILSNQVFSSLLRQ